MDVHSASLDSQGYLNIEARRKMMRALMSYAETEDVTSIQVLYTSSEVAKVHEERWIRSVPLNGLVFSVLGADGRRFHLEYERKTLVRHLEI
jgi:hypothetical protein